MSATTQYSIGSFRALMQASGLEPRLIASRMGYAYERFPAVVGGEARVTAELVDDEGHPVLQDFRIRHAERVPVALDDERRHGHRGEFWKAGLLGPAGRMQPISTSSTAPGSTPARSSAARTTTAPSSDADVFARVPLKVPIAVLAAETMTASFMLLYLQDFEMFLQI